MSREAVATALDEAAEALARAAHALRGMDPPAPSGVPASVPTGAAVGAAGVPPAPAAPSTPLGVCPKHRVGWTVKEGGISKNGKPYRAFWKCGQKDDDGYCNEKPDRSWAATHNPEAELVADEVPF